KVLLQNGADVTAADKYEDTALLWAARGGNVDVAKVLIQYGADVNAVDEKEESALHYAARHGHVDIAKVLIQNGADVNAVEEDEWTALHFAAERGRVDVVKVLIQNGADVNAVQEDKWTALHIAARSGYADIAKVLLQNGADVNAVQKNNWTALWCAANRFEFYKARRKGHIHCILQLLCFGAEINREALVYDRTGFLVPINERVTLLRGGKSMGTTLMSNEERRFMWNLAFFFTIKHGGAIAFKAYYTVRSFITFHGIFMAHGYDIGNGSAWRQYDAGDNKRYDDS
ncbi:MAG: ankyrin repeat domain-containing protein, partial [Pseudomonadota bacterium]|nr:ankyrin repeat domain-containing protein [Pseudomonadota bacterium]